MDAVKREALRRAGEHGIIFIDEIDKVAAREGARGGPDVSREGVQRDILPIVEGSTVTTKHGTLKTDHVLFIAAGAFHMSKPSDLFRNCKDASRFASSWTRSPPKTSRPSSPSRRTR